VDSTGSIAHVVRERDLGVIFTICSFHALANVKPNLELLLDDRSHLLMILMQSTDPIMLHSDPQSVRTFLFFWLSQ
jgi:hypothetical protein